MKHQSILIFLLSSAIILKGCIWQNSSEKAYTIERQYQICFPKKNTWQNPAPTQQITDSDVHRILADAHVVASNSCIHVGEVKIAGKPEVFSWKEGEKLVQVNGLVIRVSCKVEATTLCQASKNAIELVLPEASVFAYDTQTFPKQLVKLPANMSSVTLSNYWDLPKIWDFGIQLDVFEVKDGNS